MEIFGGFVGFWSDWRGAGVALTGRRAEAAEEAAWEHIVAGEWGKYCRVSAGERF